MYISMYISRTSTESLSCTSSSTTSAAFSLCVLCIYLFVLCTYLCVLCIYLCIFPEHQTESLSCTRPSSTSAAWATPQSGSWVSFSFFEFSNEEQLLWSILVTTLLAPQSGAHTIAPHRDPIQPIPSNPTQSNPTYSSEARKTHDVIYF